MPLDVYVYSGYLYIFSDTSTCSDGLTLNLFFQDAIPGQECDYALVDDALPHGKLHRIKSTSKQEEKGKK